MSENLKKILKVEKGKITEGALRLIAKASEGSVRDSLSLLDRALVSQQIDTKEIDEIFVRKMLGIADRTKILGLLHLIFQGNKKKSLELLKEMVNEGIEPSNFLNDLLEIIYFLQMRKNLGSFDSDLSISESEIKMIDSISQDISISTLVLFWQFILKGLDELSIVSNPVISLEMLIVRLIHLKDMPSYETVLNNVNKEEESEDLVINKNLMKDQEKIEKEKINEDKKEVNGTSKNQIKNILQTKPDLTSLNPNHETEKDNLEKILSFEDLVKLSSKKREIELKYDLEKNVNLIKFS